MSKKKNDKKGKASKKASSLLNLGTGSDDAAYLLAVVAEPNEPPIGISQADFNILLDYGSRLPSRDLSAEETLVDFATLTPVKGKKFYWWNEPVKAKVVMDIFGRALAALIHDAAEEVRRIAETEQATEEELVEEDPLVLHVAEELFAAWFPNGHEGAHQDYLREDYNTWKESALKDARVAVEAFRNYTSE